MSDLRVVLRGLARSPLFAVVAVVSLALGIGVNTAIFSLLDQVLLRTLPVKNPHELVYLYHPGPNQGSTSSDEAGGAPFSYPMFRDLQKQQTPFTGLGASRNNLVSLAYRNNASHGNARVVSGNYFELLGVQPAIGRLLTEDDDSTIGGHPVAVLGYQYWSRIFGSDPSILNQTIMVNGYPLTIVGVAQKGFVSESIGNPSDVYLPITMRKQITPEWNGFDNRQDYWVTLFARLKPGISRAQAEAAINIPYHAGLEQDVQLLRQPKADFLARFRGKKVVLAEGQHGRGGLRNQAREPITVLMGMAVLVLLIACANVANLQMARSTAREREMAIRLSMGAARGQLIRQLLTESFFLSLIGGALGLVAARWTIHAILAAIPPSRGMTAMSENLDGRILLFCLAISVATGILFGLFPALQASKASLVNSLKDQAGQISSSAPANAFRKILATAQVAISLVLLISAGLFAKTLVNLSAIDLGVRVDHLMTFSLFPKMNQYTDQRIAQLHEQLIGRLSAIPGARLVSGSQVPAIAGWNSSTSIVVEGYTPPGDINAQSNINVVGSDFFRTLGMPLIAGREFAHTDNASAPKVVMINEAFARKFFPGQNPLGRHIGGGGRDGKGKPDMEIVGIVKDAKYSDMKEPPPPVFYPALEQSSRWNSLFYYVRTTVEPDKTANLIRREVSAIDPNLPIREMKTMQAQIEENTFAERIMSTLTGGFAILATILAAVGLYGVLAFNIARRTREIGIRMALGANSRQVRLLVAREVGLMLLIGTAVGLGAAAASAKLVASFLYGMRPWDIFVYSTSAGALWLVALGAAYIPSRRATSIDPMVALRYE